MTDRPDLGAFITCDYKKYLGSTGFGNWLAAHVDGACHLNLQGVVTVTTLQDLAVSLDKPFDPLKMSLHCV